VLAICVNMALVTVLHAISITRLLQFKHPLFDYVKLASGALIMAAICKWLFTSVWVDLPEMIAFLLTIISGITCYLIMMIAIGMIGGRDLRRIVWIGKKLHRR